MWQFYYLQAHQIAAGIARRLDECVAREELGLRTTDERLGIAG